MEFFSGIYTLCIFVHCSKLNWNLEMPVLGRDETGEPGKTLGARTKTSNKFNPHMSAVSGKRSRKPET